MNATRTAMLLAALTAIFMGFGFLLGGSGGALVAFLLAAGLNLVGYWNADKIVLRMHNARQVDERTAPEFVALISQLAGRAGLPMPRVYLVDDQQPNAFATGRNPENAAVAATTGLLRTLTREELAGVMAHELAHVKNRDTLTMTITATLAGAISMLANFAFFFGGNRNSNSPLGPVAVLLAAITAPIAAMLVQMAVSRTREYSADRDGAAIAGDPRWLASALAKIAGAAHRMPMASAERNPATAHLFIVNPLTGHGMDNLFSTHPATENRIAALLGMAPAGSIAVPAAAAPQPQSNAPRRTGPWAAAPSSGTEPQPGPWSAAGSSTNGASRSGPWG